MSEGNQDNNEQQSSLQAEQQQQEVMSTLLPKENEAKLPEEAGKTLQQQNESCSSERHKQQKDGTTTNNNNNSEEQKQDEGSHNQQNSSNKESALKMNEAKSQYENLKAKYRTKYPKIFDDNKKRQLQNGYDYFNGEQVSLQFPYINTLKCSIKEKEVYFNNMLTNMKKNQSEHHSVFLDGEKLVLHLNQESDLIFVDCIFQQDPILFEKIVFNSDKQSIVSWGNSKIMIQYAQQMKLNFNSQNGDPKTNIDVKGICSWLEQFQSLHTLILDVSSNTLTEGSIRTIGDSLCKLKGLKNLNLLFGQCGLRANGVRELCEVLTKCDNLNTLVIDLKRCYAGVSGVKALSVLLDKLGEQCIFFDVILSSQIERILFELLTINHSKQRLPETILSKGDQIDIRVLQNQLDSDEIKMLFNQIALVFPLITSLNLDLSSCGLNDVSIEFFEEILLKLANLQILTLNLSHNNVSYQGMFRLGQKLARMQTLMKLDLGLISLRDNLFFELGLATATTGDHLVANYQTQVVQISPHANCLQFTIDYMLSVNMTPGESRLFCSSIKEMDALRSLTIRSLNVENRIFSNMVISTIITFKRLNCLTINIPFMPDEKTSYNHKKYRQDKIAAFRKMPRLVELTIVESQYDLIH